MEIRNPEASEGHAPAPPGRTPAAGGHVTRRHPTRHGEILERGPETLLADHATRFTLEHLEVERGSRAAEPGCGTGVLSIFAALAGAASVVGTDVDSRAVDLARRNAALNGVRNVAFVRGSLLEPVATGLDLVVALLPHKPGPRPFDARYYGGPDGTDLLLAVIRQAADRLAPGGRLVLYVNSIANPRRVEAAFAGSFDVRLLAEKRRDFTREELDGLTSGMFEHLEAQRARGEAEFWRDERGLYFLARLHEGRRR